MRYDYMVKVNGVYYKAGEDVPTGASSKPVEAPKDDVKGGAKYTKEAIQKMKVADLRKLAQENGVKDVDESTGTELKEILIEKLCK